MTRRTDEPLNAFPRTRSAVIRADPRLGANRIKDPDEWKTGDEPITGAQQSYLETLAAEAGEEVEEETLTKAEAAKRIDELQEKTGRGKQSG